MTESEELEIYRKHMEYHVIKIDKQIDNKMAELAIKSNALNEIKNLTDKILQQNYPVPGHSDYSFKEKISLFGEKELSEKIKEIFNKYKLS